ncbi:alpha/beta fold hydrolase [Nocardiopsis sediminis]|uniref:Alpha/beta fold hydrolase n=1 Tax=Nocardiopsis sediminis TaxID=1778267 RepID=A0ABV8FWH2_9ACTN
MTADAFRDHRDLALPGGPLRVYEAGPAAGRPVVLLHGAMLDTAPFTWRHLMPVLARDHRVIAPDLPRHGGSRPWSGTLDQARLSAVLTGLLDRLEVERADLVGLSMGGGLAIGHALDHPERVRSVVASAPGGVEARRPAQFATWLVSRSDALLRWSAAWVAASPALLRRSMERSLAAGARTPDFAGLMALAGAEARLQGEHRQRVLDDWQIVAYGPRRMRFDLSPRLPELVPPSLWLHGEHDHLVPAEAVRRAAAAAPGGRFVPIAGAGHLAPLDRPGRFAELVTAFLADAAG